MKKLILAFFCIFSSYAHAVRSGSLSNNDEVVTPSELSAALSPVEKQIRTVESLVIGDDCQLVSTNYNSVTKLPSLFLRFKIKDEATGSNVWYKVWDEMTRWRHLFDEYLPTNYLTKTQVQAELDQKADRAWGHYSSHTGAYAPDGFTWIDSPKIAVAGGMAYQRVINSGNGIFVLCSNGLVTEFGNTASSTNGFFRIEDDKGNAIFEITKGTAAIASATADGISIRNFNGVAHMYIPYKVESAEHPKIYACTDLSVKDWKAEGEEGFLFNVNWTGQSGAWVAEVWAKQPTTEAFVKAEYKKGAEDIIRHNAPASFSKVEIGGVIYRCSVEVMNGKKVLVLE
jgi:hypothetical protein